MSEYRFLGLETNLGNTKLITLLLWDENPAAENNHFPKNIRYVARFNDILAAQMNFHRGMRKQLRDINTYKADLSEAIAVLEANEDSRHKRIWIDPKISNQTLAAVQSKFELKRIHKKIINRIIQFVGIAPLCLLVFCFFGSV